MEYLTIPPPLAHGSLPDQIVALNDTIEDLRNYLNKFAGSRSLTDPDVVWVSQRLERLLNEYYRVAI